MLVASTPAHPISTVITIAAAGGTQLAINATLTRPTGIIFDGAGNYYFSDAGPASGARIYKVDTSGQISVVAGTGIDGFSGDGGPATAAQLSNPMGLAFDGAGILYVVDANRVRKIDASGVITTFAGNGSAGFSGDGGAATSAMLNAPTWIAADVLGNVFVSDTGNNRVRKIAAGVITTVAGNGTGGYSVDPAGSPPTGAAITPSGIVTDGAGGFCFAQQVGFTNYAAVLCVDAAGSSMRPAAPIGNYGVASQLTTDSSGNFYIAYSIVSNQVKKVTATTVTVVAGTGGYSFSGDGGPATAATFGQERGVAVAASGEIYIADTDNARIRKIGLDGIIHTVAGSGTTSSSCPADGSPFTGGSIPGRTATDGSGRVYVPLVDANCVIRVDASAIATRIAGTGIRAFSGDGGLATAAQLYAPSSVALDAAGNVYIADSGNNRVRKVDVSGNIATFAGSVNYSRLGDDGPASQAGLWAPWDVAVDAAGNVFIADSVNARVRVVDTSGVIHTVAGNGSSGSSGDGGPAIGAAIAPAGIALDSAGNLFIADFNHGNVRRVDAATGTISTIAGGGTDLGDGGLATQAYLNDPRGVDVDAEGNLYIALRQGARVRRVDASGIITTLGGTGVLGTSGDGGPADAAMIDGPWALRWDANAHALFVSDQGVSVYPHGGHVRKIAVADTHPDAFSFASQAPVPLSSTVQSAAITPTGFTSDAPISVAGGEYSIGCTGTFVSTAGTITPGQSVCVQHTSSSVNNADVVTTLTLGGVPGTFTSTTVVGAGSIGFAPAVLDFGSQSMRTDDAPAQSLTITNNGAVTVTINAVRTSASFPLTQDCTTLAPGASCTVTVSFVPLDAGGLATALQIQASSGTQSASLQGTGERSLTIHYYHAILRREPDATGKLYWDGEAQHMQSLGANVNETWFAMAMSFFFSTEYASFNRDDTGFTTDLYETFFNRAPDSGGLAYWVGLLGQGMPREVLLASFMFSPEFTNFSYRIFGNTAARAEVDMTMDFYRGLLGRLPDDTGFNTWVGRFRTAQCQSSFAVTQAAEDISSQFVVSAEYVGRNRTNAQFVGDLYNAFMRRGGDLPGVQYWIGQLDSGVARDTVRHLFTTTTEFQNRARRLTYESCMP